jgi:hypothetical protein
MLDMGGAPTANSDQSLIRTVNASKNSRLQAVAFDFQTLININENNDVGEDQMVAKDQRAQESRESSSSTMVDAGRVEQIAALLNVDLGSSSNAKKRDDIDLTSSWYKQQRNKQESKLKDHNPNENDVRAKYASKLKGGLAGIALAKSQVEETLTSGDSAGHLAARKIAIMEDASNIPNDNSNASKRWLPSLAATQLLTLLTHRSIRIVLLPTLGTKSTREEDNDEPRMEDLKAQLKTVIIDNIIPKFDSDEGIEDALRTGILDELDVDPNKVLLVSKRDPYLRVARDMGMSICRLQPKNARRGNITAHYTVQSLEELQDIVNEINGISFNTVLNR